MSKFKRSILAMLGISLALSIGGTFAQDTTGTDVNAAQQANDAAKINEKKLEQLQYIQDVLTAKVESRRALGEQIETANEQDKDDLRKQADAFSTDIEQLRTTLENIAIGGLDTSLFATTDAKAEKDWREDIALIAEPVIDSLKEITEKPRKLAELNDSITQSQLEIAATKKALANLEPSLALDPTGELKNTLEQLSTLWQERENDANNSIAIAQIQIAELQGDRSLSETLYDALLGFITGRGLTILMAVIAAALVWYALRFLLRGYRVAISNDNAPERRTRYRVAAYGVHALTFVFTLLAVFVVFYERGDVLLLGLLILLVVGLALGIRHLLPRYVSEARLLLNVGAMRENERVFFAGLPWRVQSINMYTTLKNPELSSSLRVPLAKLDGTISRAVSDEWWFPTSKGDFVLLSDDTVHEVISQNPDTVELRERGGQITSIPSTDFYTTTMINLTRGGSFGVSSTFGVDYQHQSISLSHIPDILISSVKSHLMQSGLDSSIQDVQVELKEANSSSLDYWVFVTCESDVAHAYLEIQRLIQSACVDACTKESLNIPFPHLSIISK